MSAARDHMRRMVDELLGVERYGENRPQLRDFTNHDVCHCFLMNCCPQELLLNTPMSLGPCGRKHDYALKAHFQSAADKLSSGFYQSALIRLERIIDNCASKDSIKKGKFEVKIRNIRDEMENKRQEEGELVETVKKYLKKAERLGSRGEVTRSVRQIEKSDMIKMAIRDKQKEYRDLQRKLAYAQEELSRQVVCEECQLFVGPEENESKFTSHKNGRLHKGIICIRQKIDELKQLLLRRYEANIAKQEKNVRSEETIKHERTVQQDESYRQGATKFSKLKMAVSAPVAKHETRFVQQQKEAPIAEFKRKEPANRGRRPPSHYSSRHSVPPPPPPPPRQVPKQKRQVAIASPGRRVYRIPDRERIRYDAVDRRNSLHDSVTHLPGDFSRIPDDCVIKDCYADDLLNYRYLRGHIQNDTISGCNQHRGYTPYNPLLSSRDFYLKR